MYKVFLFLSLALVTNFSEAFTSRTAFMNAVSSSFLTRTRLDAVVDIDNEGSFDKTIKNAGDSLVVVDYSTTW